MMHRATHEAAWSMPKGLVEPDEESLEEAAEREFTEEMGRPPPSAERPDIDLGTVRSGDKVIHGFAREGEFPADDVISNTFDMEWPPGGAFSGCDSRNTSQVFAVTFDQTTLVPGPAERVAGNQTGFSDSTFDDPRGQMCGGSHATALIGDRLYVRDQGNNAIRYVSINR